MSVIQYYKGALEDMLEVVKNYVNGNELGLLDQLYDFTRMLKIDIRNDMERIHNEEVIRELQENGRSRDYY
jgi:hypothetical protein